MMTWMTFPEAEGEDERQARLGGDTSVFQD